MSDLTTIQNELKAPKNQRNSFGNYNYRSCEDILEAVKPLIAKYGCGLYISDSIDFQGDRYYVKARVEFLDSNGVKTISEAYARESETKKGMDASQITGAASSYARKYALNGLFLIDDTKDADATNKHNDDVPQGFNGSPEIPADVLETISRIDSLEELRQFYKDNIKKFSDQKEEFTRLLEEQKTAIKILEETDGNN